MTNHERLPLIEVFDGSNGKFYLRRKVPEVRVELFHEPGEWATHLQGPLKAFDSRESAEQFIRSLSPTEAEASDGAGRFRKKPVVIEAIRLGRASPATVFAFFGGFQNIVVGTDHVIIKTLEGNMRADDGDWIIKGVKGEFYPCKPDIFEASYEPAPSPAAPATLPESEQIMPIGSGWTWIRLGAMSNINSPPPSPKSKNSKGKWNG
jgi:hypothetical protein